MELKTALDELSEKFKDCIPNSNLVLATSRCTDIISIKEWLDFFEGFSQVTLEEGMMILFILIKELVWPASKPFFVATNEP